MHFHALISSLLVESNSLMVVQALQERGTALAQHRTIIKEIPRLSKRFQNCSFHYVSHVGNVGAHKLACYAW